MRRGAFLTIIFLMAVLISSPAFAGQSAADDANTFQIKLPDGLYLYSFWAGQDYFSPLFIIEDGKLIDPYMLLKKQGQKSFAKKYIKDRQFNVFQNKESMGKLSDFELTPYECETKAFLRYLSGRGTYEGRPLHNVKDTVIKPDYLVTDIFAILKGIAAPADIGMPVAKIEFNITDENIDAAIKAIKKNLVPQALKRMEKSIKKHENIVAHITSDKGTLDSIIAVDIDNNGKKELLGIYTLQGINKTNSNAKEHLAGISEIIFVLWDTGDIEMIMSSEDDVPAFSIGGLIDIDRDGTQELIVHKSIFAPSQYSEEGYIDRGVQISVLRRGAAGWENIYQSAGFCKDIAY